MEIIKKYPETRVVLPLLLAVRYKFNMILDSQTKVVNQVTNLFNKNVILNKDMENNIIKFFCES